MSNYSWKIATAALVSGVVFAAPVAQAAQPDPVISIKVVNQAGAFPGNLAIAQTVATGIYKRAGVTLLWDLNAEMGPNRTLTVVLSNSGASPSLASDVLGHAPSPGDDTRGTRAYVLIDRVVEFATSHHLAISQLLGCALAHEIGHLLLPPNAHTSNGIMQGNWNPSQLPPATPGVPAFSPEQARLLRLRVQGRE